jgi:hypothetical protein
MSKEKSMISRPFRVWKETSMPPVLGKENVDRRLLASDVFTSEKRLFLAGGEF